jgi:RHS repeat-associated protein
LHDFNYDGLNRLTQASRPASSGVPNENYLYDRVGNREDPGNAALYGYDNNNRITASPGLTYTFDADGSLATRSDAAMFTHDAQNRLTQYVKGATTATYLYDESGRRIRKTVNGANTWFLSDGTQLLAEYKAAGTRTQRYGYLQKDYVPTQLQDANGTYYVHSDHLQTPRLATNSAAQIVWRSRHEAFGKATIENDPDGNGAIIALNFRFPGQYFDGESGTHYNYFREYDPGTGRYWQSDPVGLVGGVNTYAYVLGNPLRLFDFYGLEPCDWQDFNARREQAERAAADARANGDYDRYNNQMDIADANTRRYHDAIHQPLNGTPTPRGPVPPGSGRPPTPEPKMPRSGLY